MGTTRKQGLVFFFVAVAFVLLFVMTMTESSMVSAKKVKRVVTTKSSRLEKKMKKVFLRLIKRYGSVNHFMVNSKETSELNQHLNRVKKRLLKTLTEITKKFKTIKTAYKAKRLSYLKKKGSYKFAKKMFKKMSAKYLKFKSQSEEEKKQWELAEQKLKEWTEIVQNELKSRNSYKKALAEARKLRNKHNGSIKAQLRLIESLRGMVGSNLHHKKKPTEESQKTTQSSPSNN